MPFGFQRSGYILCQVDQAFKVLGTPVRNRLRPVPTPHSSSAHAIPTTTARQTSASARARCPPGRTPKWAAASSSLCHLNPRDWPGTVGGGDGVERLHRPVEVAVLGEADADAVPGVAHAVELGVDRIPALGVADVGVADTVDRLRTGGDWPERPYEGIEQDLAARAHHRDVDDLGSPGGASKVGKIDKDHPVVAELPPREDEH